MSKTRGAAVYACHSDVTNEKVLSLAFASGLVSKETKETPELITNTEVADILENLFGFSLGSYYDELVEGWQTTRFGNKVIGEVRYMGVEREDKDWIATGMASKEVIEISKYGEVLQL